MECLPFEITSNSPSSGFSLSTQIIHRMGPLRWLNLQAAATGSCTPMLFEDHNLYSQLPATSPPPKMTLWIRGPKAAAVTDQVWLHNFDDTIIVECGMHMKTFEHLQYRVPRNPGSLHRVETAPVDKLSDISHRLYSLVLMSLVTGVVFIQEEFNSLGDILHILAHWAILSRGQTRNFRPFVALAHISQPARDLRFNLTSEILASFNPTADLTSSTATEIWQSCFSALKKIHISNITASTPMVRICQQAARTASRLTESPNSNPLPATADFHLLLHASVCHHIDCHSTILIFTSPSRKFPVSPHLKYSVHQSFNMGLSYQLAIDTATACLVEDADHSQVGLRSKS